MNKALTTAVLLLCSATLEAQQPPTAPSSDANNSSPSGSERKPGNAAFEAAIQECMTQAGKDSSGRPDRQAVDACMTAKGYTKPSGPPPQGGPGAGGPGASTSESSPTQ